MKHLTIAIVTGASSGMGREFVKLLDKESILLDEIWVIARRGDRLRELAAKVNTKLVPLEVDVAGTEAAAVLGYMLREKNPSVKFLINCAGFGKIGKVKNLPLADQLSMVKVNCVALTEITGLVLPYMAKKSRIINLASAAAFLPQPGFAVYAATKSYVLSFSRALNQELARTGIRVTAVCPGPVKTEFFDLAEQTGTMPVYKKLVMADPVAVVKKAYWDAMAGRDVSVYGGAIQLLRVFAKGVPHRLILRFFR